MNPAVTLLQAQIEAKRAEIHLRSALAALAGVKEETCPEAVDALAEAIAAANRAGTALCAAVQKAEQQECWGEVVDVTEIIMARRVGKSGLGFLTKNLSDLFKEV